MRYLLPWEREIFKGRNLHLVVFTRKEFGTGIIRSTISSIDNICYYNTVGSCYYSFKEAAEVEDNWLINHKYYLINPEDVERFENRLKLLI